MTSKKIIVIFLLILLILSIFSFSSVHAENITENINVTSSSVDRMQADIDYLKLLLKNNNINNMSDLGSFLGVDKLWTIRYVYIEDAGHTITHSQFAYFYPLLDVNDISMGVDNYSYYGIQQNSFTLAYNFGLRWYTEGVSDLFIVRGSSNSTFTAPSCWLLVRTADLFTIDSSQIVANAVGNVENSVENVNKSVENVNKSVGDVNKSVGDVNNSINNLNDKITEDNSSQDDINLSSHNDEMNNASDTIKNSTLYSKFNNIVDKMNDAFSYSDDEPIILQIFLFGKSFVIPSNLISYFLKNNNLGFVITLWQSILWFSLFYTMFIFIRKLYKAFTGGNPVDDVSSTLSQEDNKIVGGF